jgi:hypothetical protein
MRYAICLSLTLLLSLCFCVAQTSSNQSQSDEQTLMRLEREASTHPGTSAADISFWKPLRTSSLVPVSNQS